MVCSDEEYILEKYRTQNKDVEIANSIKKEVISISNHVINMAERGITIPFYDIIEMKNILLNK